MNRNHKTVISLFIFSILFASISLAQDSLPSLAIQSISDDFLTISNRTSANISIPLYSSHGYTAISQDGDAMVADGKSVSWSGSNAEIRELNLPNLKGVKKHLNSRGNVLCYLDQNQDTASICFLDLNTGQEIARHSITKNHFLDSIIHLAISDNAQRIAYSYLDGPSGEKIFVVDRNGSQFSKPHLVGEVELVSKLELTSSGNQLYYNARVRENSNNLTPSKTPNYYRSFVADHLGDEWTAPELLSHPNIEQPFLMNIALNGNLLAVNEPKKGLALIRKIGENWLPPEYLDIHPTAHDRIQMAETGNVIAIASMIQSQSTYQRDQILFYDLFLYHQSESDEWMKSQLNESNIVSNGEFLLSRNGRKIYWLPYQTN